VRSSRHHGVGCCGRWWWTVADIRVRITVVGWGGINEIWVVGKLSKGSKIGFAGLGLGWYLLSRFMVRFARLPACFGPSSSIVERTNGWCAQFSSFVGSVGRGASRTGPPQGGGGRSHVIGTVVVAAVVTLLMLSLFGFLVLLTCAFGPLIKQKSENTIRFGITG
jgi:hypothetical protein